jgi:hypothetical protein
MAKNWQKGRKSSKIHQNSQKFYLLGLLDSGTPDILLKLFIKLRSGVVKVYKSYFSKYWGCGDQKSSK